jgi:O-antigen/teichoic acid export membrane protein
MIVLAHPIVIAWVGPRFAGSVPVLYILALVVLVRVGTQTGSTVLKGAGRHRFLAFNSLGIALANLCLSILLAPRFGLLGVAIGTIIPVAAVSLLVLFPASCRRVEMPILRVLRLAVWPAVWPAIPMGALLLWARTFVPAKLSLLALTGGAAGLVYILIFVGCAVPARERRWYFDKAISLIRPGLALPA